jgi:hypothetical protein
MMPSQSTRPIAGTSLFSRSTSVNAHGFNSPEFARAHQLQPLPERAVWKAPQPVVTSREEPSAPEPLRHPATALAERAAYLTGFPAKRP